MSRLALVPNALIIRTAEALYRIGESPTPDYARQTMNENAMKPLPLISVFIILALSCFARLPSASSAEQPRPNVVFVLADDLGYGDINCFGGDRCQVDTPHFDRLAREGFA